MKNLITIITLLVIGSKAMAQYPATQILPARNDLVSTYPPSIDSMRVIVFIDTLTANKHPIVSKIPGIVILVRNDTVYIRNAKCNRWLLINHG